MCCQKCNVVLLISQSDDWNGQPELSICTCYRSHSKNDFNCLHFSFVCDFQCQRRATYINLVMQIQVKLLMSQIMYDTLLHEISKKLLHKIVKNYVQVQ